MIIDNFKIGTLEQNIKTSDILGIYFRFKSNTANKKQGFRVSITKKQEIWYDNTLGLYYVLRFLRELWFFNLTSFNL